MAPKESTLLSDFLLVPADLRNILTLEQFTDIFPQSQRDSPAIKSLYQELRRLRQEDIDIVQGRIADEVKKSKSLRQKAMRERKQNDQEAVAGLDPVALDMEDELAGNNSRRKPHTLQTICPALQVASKSIEVEIQELETEVANALAEVQEVVGDLSELRYGKFSKSADGSDISEEALATLKRLQAVCEDPAG